jgi:hypothetical protein
VPVIARIDQERRDWECIGNAAVNRSGALRPRMPTLGWRANVPTTHALFSGGQGDDVD